MKGLAKVLTVIAEILAVILVIAFLLYHLDRRWDFIPDVNIGGKTIDLLATITNYGGTLFACLVALIAALKTNLIFVIIVGLVIAAVICFMFVSGPIDALLPPATNPDASSLTELVKSALLL